MGEAVIEASSVRWRGGGRWAVPWAASGQFYCPPLGDLTGH